MHDDDDDGGACQSSLDLTLARSSLGKMEGKEEGRDHFGPPPKITQNSHDLTIPHAAAGGG